MELDVVQALGYGGTAATIGSYAMRDMCALRIAAVASSLFFILYAVALGLWPVLLMEIVLLPINGFRLWQLLCARRRTADAAQINC